MTDRSPVEPSHPTPEDFEGFLRDPPRPGYAGRNALIVRHLLTGCSLCRKRLQDLRETAPTLSRILETPVPSQARDAVKPASRYNYDWAFAKAQRTLSSFLARGYTPERLPEILQNLAMLPEKEQLRRVATGSDFADPGVVEYLLDRSHAVRYESPSKMLHFAHLAHLAAEACSPEKVGGQAKLADLRAEGWRQFANALRVNGRHREAEAAFSSSLAQWTAGTGSPELRARVLVQISSLRSFQRQFAAAVEMADQAGEIFRALGKHLSLGSALIRKAIAHLYSGDAEGAIEILHQAIPLIDRKEDPRLFLAAHHNLAICHIDLGRPEEALALYCEARDLYRDSGDPLILLRAAWQEGQLLREIGHLHNAEAALLRARQGFLEAGLAYEAAMVSLDLAEVYKKAGRSDKLRRTVAEALPVFKALRVSRETLAALLRLQDAAGPEEPAPG